MCAEHFPQLRVVRNDSPLDIEDTCKSQPHLVRKTFIGALLLLPLSEQTVKRVQLGEAFRRSLQTERQSHHIAFILLSQPARKKKLMGLHLKPNFLDVEVFPLLQLSQQQQQQTTTISCFGWKVLEMPT